MESLPIAVSVFALVIAIIFGGYWMAIVRPESGERQSIRQRLRAPRKNRLLKKLEKEQEKLSSVGGVDAVLGRLEGLSTPLQRLISQSGMQMTVGTLVLASVFMGLAVATALMFLVPFRSAALVAGAAASIIPTLFVRRKARKRLEKFEEQFPEAIDLIARALRAGHALPTALQMVSDEIPQPVGEEFKLLFEQHSYGLSLPEGLRSVGDRG